MTALGAVICFVPLFNVLGYESSLLTAAVAGFVSLGLSERALAQAARRPLDPQWSGAARWYWETLLKRLLLALPGFVLLLLNALRVPSCDLVTGAALWALGPVFAIFMGHSLAWALAAPLQGSLKRLLLGVGLVLINALLMGLHIALEPPITGHQWFIGYLSGSIYDEALSVPASLLYYRGTLATGVLGVIWGLEAARLKRAASASAAAGSSWRLWALLATTLLLSWALMYSQRQRFGVELDRETIAARLGGKIETEHFVIYHGQSQDLTSQAALLAEDHEFRYAQMKRFFGTDPVALHGRKVRSFVYQDRAQKGALMGASRTLIAKIWLREMHITWSGYGDHLLAHELAHIFTEPFGRGPLRLSARFLVGVNMGLVEGVATAADDPPGELSLHEASAMMRALKIAPDIRKLLGAEGFWGQSSAKAYTLMGSFVRFLVDTYGMDKFKAAYGAGSFEQVYGEPIDVLVGRWEQLVDSLPVVTQERAIALAKFRYTRSSIFGKVCARAQAQLRDQAFDAAAAGALGAAIRGLEQLIANDPVGALQDEISLASLLLRAQRYDQAKRLISGLLQDPQERLSPVQRAQLTQLEADMAWLEGRYQDADTAYTRCLALGVPDEARRLLLVKRQSLTKAEAERAIARDYLVERHDQPLAQLLPVLWSSRAPEDPLAAYLTGRLLFGGGRFQDARPYMERARAELKEVELVEESALMLAQILTHQGELDKAHELLLTLHAAQGARVRALAAEWSERVAFKRRYKPASGIAP